jgi:hypothetical protein
MVERSLLFFVGRCANPKLCARKEHLCEIEHLCLEIPQKKATPPTIFRYGQPKATLQILNDCLNIAQLTAYNLN